VSLALFEPRKKKTNLSQVLELLEILAQVRELNISYGIATRRMKSMRDNDAKKYFTFDNLDRVSGLSGSYLTILPDFSRFGQSTSTWTFSIVR